jgi:hypothetical protein
MLTEARSLDDLRTVMEAAGHAEDAARRVAKLAEAQGMTSALVRDAEAARNDAAAIHIEAQAVAGEILRAMKEQGQRHAGQGGDQRSGLRADTVTLKELGVSKTESKNWQDVAAIPPDVRRVYVKETKKEHGEVSTAGLKVYVKAAAPDGDPPPAPGAPEKARPRRYSEYRDGLLNVKPKALMVVFSPSAIRADLVRIRGWCDKIEAALTGN